MSFLETCKSYKLCLAGLNIQKKLFIEFEASDLKVFLNETKKTEGNPFRSSMHLICERLLTIEEKFWVELSFLAKQQESEDLKEWLVKLILSLEKEIEKIIKRKRKKLKKLCTGETSK